MTTEVKTVAVSGFSIALVETVSHMQLEQTVTFGIQTVIGILTIVYLSAKIYRAFKSKTP